jgi:2'-5' RNA ligase
MSSGHQQNVTETEATQVLRLFIAVQVPEEIKAEMEKAQSQLRRALPEAAVRWSKREQFHLTLRFLGSVKQPRLAPLLDALRGACQDFVALKLRAKDLGFFPSQRVPRVIWAGVADALDQLPRLQKAVQSASADFTGEKPEEEFSGHITLGRVKKLNRSQSAALVDAASRAERDFGEWVANEICLMESRLSPQGAIHSVVAPVPLA